MMNFGFVKAIHNQAQQFSQSKSVNATVTARCLKAIGVDSMEGLCAPIQIKSYNEKFEVVTLVMEPAEVEKRLKECGLYQMVEGIMATLKVTSEFTQLLDSLLMCSFGSAEVEGEIRKRAIEAVEQGTMEPLMKRIDMQWRNGECIMSAEAVMARLHEKGIWQLVQSEIKKQKGE